MIWFGLVVVQLLFSPRQRCLSRFWSEKKLLNNLTRQALSKWLILYDYPFLYFWIPTKRMMLVLGFFSLRLYIDTLFTVNTLLTLFHAQTYWIITCWGINHVQYISPLLLKVVICRLKANFNEILQLPSLQPITIYF